MKASQAKASLILLVAIVLQTALSPALAQSALFEDFKVDNQSEAIFRQLWQQVDGPVVANQAARSWLWGPGPFATLEEAYQEALPDGKRSIMYFDKARMELNNPAMAEVSYGLLVTEMISGNIQLGDNIFQASPDGPAKTNVVGDTGNWLTYARLKPYASINNDKRAPDRTGQTVDKQLTETAGVQTAPTQAGQQSLSYYEPNLGHNIPKIFWDFLNQEGRLYYPQIKGYSLGRPIHWEAELGYPLTEAYWVRQKVGGVEKEVLVQAFQRRTLTFTPDNPSPYQVEMGNVGRHYVQWRYGREFGPNQSWSAPPIDPAGLREVVRGPVGKKRVALTLDAGSTAVAFPREIAALDKYKVKITFFLTGRWTLENPEYARYIAADHMEIANHTLSHPDLTTLTNYQVQNEINQGARAIELVTGKTPRPFFRFPYGARDDRVMKLVNDLGYRSIYWTYDSLDSVGPAKSADFLISRVTGFSDTELDGAIILMHLGNLTSGEALGPILDNLIRRGFKIVTVSELIS